MHEPHILAGNDRLPYSDIDYLQSSKGFYGSGMTRRFVDIAIFHEHRFSLGMESKTGAYFLSTPISGFNRAVEYEAFFRISAEEFERYRDNPGAAEAFLEMCRNYGNEDRRLA